MDVQKSCNAHNVPLIEGGYNDTEWIKNIISKKLEDMPEKGARCDECFDFRLYKSALKAKEIGAAFFTTTLLSSPQKSKYKLQKSLLKISSTTSTTSVQSYYFCVASDEVALQNKIARDANLYRQNYCGCIFGLVKQKGEMAFELFSPMGNKIYKNSIENKKNEFAKDGISIKNRLIDMRLLSGKISSGGEIVPSYIFDHSSTTSCKSGEIAWIKLQNLRQLICGKISKVAYLGLGIDENAKFDDLYIGYSRRESLIFCTLGLINAIFGNKFEDIKSLNKSGLSMDDEVLFRLLVTDDSLNITPIIVVDDKIKSAKVEISSITKEENIVKMVHLDK